MKKIDLKNNLLTGLLIFYKESFYCLLFDKRELKAAIALVNAETKVVALSIGGANLS